MNKIYIVRGDDTNFDNGELFKIVINSDAPLTGFSGSLKLGTVVLSYPDISSGEIDVNLTSSQTRQLQLGDSAAIFSLIDPNGRVKTIVSIPVTVVDVPVATCPKSQEVSVNLVSVTIVHNTRDYNDLKNLPQISGTIVQGDLTPEDLNLVSIDKLNDDLNTGISDHNLSNTSHQDIRNLINQDASNISNILDEIKGLGDQMSQLSERVTALENK